MGEWHRGALGGMTAQIGDPDLDMDLVGVRVTGVLALGETFILQYSAESGVMARSTVRRVEGTLTVKYPNMTVGDGVLADAMDVLLTQRGMRLTGAPGKMSALTLVSGEVVPLPPSSAPVVDVEAPNNTWW